MEEIDRKIRDRNREILNQEPVYDGIMNVAQWVNTKPKVLWILKEPYDDDGGGWKMSDLINKFRNNQGISMTWRRIIFSSWGILYDVESWNDLNGSELRKMSDVLNRIAYINIKKMIGARVSPRKVIAEAYRRDGDIIDEQIRLIDADIVVFGGTYKWFEAMVPSKNKVEYLPNSNAASFYQDGKIFIDSHHPAYYKNISDEDYCMDIIRSVRRRERLSKPLSIRVKLID